MKLNIENILMIFTITILLFVLLLSIAYADSSNNWTKEDTAYQAVFSGLLIADWLQTSEAVNQGYKENNPILGKHPSQNSIDAFGASMLIGHFAVSKLLPKEYRRKWQIFCIGIETKNVIHNYQIGIRVRW